MKMEAKADRKAVKKAVKKAAKKVSKKSYPSLAHAAMAMSDYIKTILDPVNVVGVRIPDEVTLPSFTCQVLTKFTLSPNTGAGGNTGAGFWRVLGSSLSATGYATLAASATVNQYGPAVGQASPWATQFNSQSSSYRLVSAKATMTYLGSPNNVTGRFLLAFVPPNALLATLSGNVALSGAAAGQNLLQAINLVDVPASKLYAEARFIPIDDQARSYETTGSSANSTLRGPSSGMTYGQFIGILDGCPVGTGSIEVNIWENYECIPQTSLVNLVQPHASLSDPLEMAAASNIIASVPTIPSMQSPVDQLAATAQAAPSSLGNAATSTKTSSVTEAPSSGTFTDKILSSANGLFDTAKKAAPLIGEIAALL